MIDVEVNEGRRARKRRSDCDDSLWLGVMMILAGAAFLLYRFGVLPLTTIWHWWPLVTIAMGAASLVAARSPRKIGSAVTFLLFGVYFLLADGRYFGLNWGNSWPLALIAVGGGMVAQSIAAAFWRRDEGDIHVS